MPGNQHPYTNHLIHEKSPYLIQHAHNPVDWYPWGKEALKASVEMDRPIFLSIGYSTCHWCHVMERECFEDPEIAKLMNEIFINIKVDREEMPHLDNIYMEFAQSMMTGAAGWPLNVVLTPELKPFFATTYLPPEGTYGLMGLKDLIFRLKDIWNGEEREKVVLQANKIVEVFAKNLHLRGGQIPHKQVIEEGAQHLFKTADPIYGGMKETPKFPMGYQLSFLLNYFYTDQDNRALFLVERTLDMMQRGGIYDHLGGGFSRYCVDEKWLVPHFEKMLYDNAILVDAYSEAWQITKKEFYRQIAEEVIQFVLRELTDSQGGFCSAQDAETEGKEGYFYTWTKEEICQILGEGTDAQIFCDYYAVSDLGNFEGRNILNTPLRIEEFAGKRGLEPEQLESKIFEQKERLFKARAKKVQPFKDDKVLCSKNGLMIHSLVKAAVAFDNKIYLKKAVQAMEFIRQEMWVEGALFRRFCKGQALYSANLDDYAFLIRALITLFEVEGEHKWLAWAIEMSTILQEKFKVEKGAFFQTDGEDPSLILRKCQFSDGSEPSGNSIHCENLLRLYQLTLDNSYLSQAEDILKAAQKYLDSYSLGYCYHLMNLNRYFDKKAPAIVISLNKKEEYKDQIFRLINESFIPHKAVIWRKENDQPLFKLLPFVKQQPPIAGKTTVYICYEGICQSPLNDYPEIVSALEKL